jgi:hypothetical protein
MASQIEFTLSGDHVAARDIVLVATTAAGFTAAAGGDWSYQLTRGSSTKSLWLGAMAGKDFYLKFALDFSVDSAGGFVARLSRDVASSAVRGGVIGASKASDAFQSLADAVGSATTQAGVFASTRTVA